MKNIMLSMLLTVSLSAGYDHTQDLMQQKHELVMHNKPLLFGYMQCPYCVKVIQFLHSQNLLQNIDFIDSNVPENRELLLKISGKTQVPYLVDQEMNVAMPESDDIIAHFMKKYH